MPRRALTDRLVQSLTSNGKSQFEHFDGYAPGLLLRVSSSGRKVWDFAFKCPTDGKRARMKIGPYPAISLADARQAAHEAQRLMAAGRDPRIVESAPAPKLMRELVEDRLAMELRGKRRSAEAVEWRANKYILPAVANVAVSEFRIDPHYNSIIDPVLRREKVRMAGMLFQDLRGYW